VSIRIVFNVLNAQYTVHKSYGVLKHITECTNLYIDIIVSTRMSRKDNERIDFKIGDYLTTFYRPNVDTWWEKVYLKFLHLNLSENSL